ncbi:UNVERIFIED_ORG: hypothetical protein J2Y77_004915 [Pseudomonas lini]
MNFTRTNSGLSNSAAFHGVDFIVYSEGGEYDPELKCSKWAIDTIFWGGVFSKYIPSLQYKFRPLGSKENVVPVAKKIAESKIANTIVVMDRDHDSHRGCVIKHPCVIYTYGYSWENDAWRADNLISKLAKLSPEREVNSQIKKQINDQCKNFYADFRRLVYIDVLCSIGRIKGLDREKFWSYVDQKNCDRLKVKKEKFRELIKDVKLKRVAPFKYSGGHSIDAERDCYGKLLAKFFYGIFCDSYKKITGAKNLNRFDADLMIAEHIEHCIFEEEQGINLYYLKKADKLLKFIKA